MGYTGSELLYRSLFTRKIKENKQVLKCMGGNVYILLPFNFLLVSNQTILKRKSLCLKTIETNVIVKRL